MVKKEPIILCLIYSIYSRRSFMMRNVVLSTFMMASGLATLPTYAASPATTQFNVTITVTESCLIEKPSDINFADVDRSTNNAQTAQGKLNVTCTKGTPYKVGLANSGKMTNTADAASTIAYVLYQDTATSQIWDNSQNLFAQTGSGTVQALPVYAKLAGNTNAKAGTYSDTVVATVTY